MARRYSTRSRRASGSATAEPAIGGLTGSGVAPGDDAGQYPGAARLGELVDACAVPGRLVLVTGPAGSGKSELCEALLDDIDPTRCAVNVSARHDDPYPYLLASILEAYGFKVEPGTSQQVMSDLITHHAADPGAPGRQCVVAVDDADALPLRELRELLKLVAGSALTLVLAGPALMVPSVRLIAEQVALEWVHIELGDAGAGQGEAASAWHQGRGGRSRSGRRAAGKERNGAEGASALGALLQAVRTRLASAQGPSGGVPGPFGFPLRHLVVLAGLVLVLLVVYIVGKVAEDVTQTAVSTQRVETLTMPPLATPDEVPGTTAGPGGPAEQPAAEEPSVARQIELPRPAQAGDSAAEPAAPRPIIARQPPAGASGAPPAPAAGQSAAESAAAREGAAATPTPAPAGTPPAPATRATTPTARQPAPPASTASTPAAAPASGGSARNASWILGQPAASYTVQLVSLSSAERARAYIAQQPDPASFATYRLMRNGQLFHVVTYGSFASKAQADQAAANLPASVGNIQPWVRTFGQVQDSIRTTPQQ
jgi:DamX protein